VIGYLGVIQLRVAVAGDHRQTRRAQSLGGTHQIDDLFGACRVRADQATRYGVEHRASWRKVEGNVVCQGAADPARHDAKGAAPLDVVISDLNPRDLPVSTHIVRKQSILDNAGEPLNSRHVEHTGGHRAGHHPIMPCECRAVAQRPSAPWQGSSGRELRRLPVVQLTRRSGRPAGSAAVLANSPARGRPRTSPSCSAGRPAPMTSTWACSMPRHHQPGPAGRPRRADQGHGGGIPGWEAQQGLVQRPVARAVSREHSAATDVRRVARRPARADPLPGRRGVVTAELAGAALLREALSDAVSYRDPPLYCPPARRCTAGILAASPATTCAARVCGWSRPRPLLPRTRRGAGRAPQRRDVVRALRRAACPASRAGA
jgi:hypothetical protein